VRLRDMAVMLEHVRRGATDDNVGFEDANRTLEAMLAQLDKKILLDPSIIESALWSCNMFAERGKFRHPEGRTIDEFIKDVLGGEKFDKTYHLIVPKEGK
jgi:hypothetical protein